MCSIKSNMSLNALSHKIQSIVLNWGSSALLSILIVISALTFVAAVETVLLYCFKGSVGMGFFSSVKTNFLSLGTDFKDCGSWMSLRCCRDERPSKNAAGQSVHLNKYAAFIVIFPPNSLAARATVGKRWLICVIKWLWNFVNFLNIFPQ